MAARVFISYAHADEPYRSQLEKQLDILCRAGLVEIWHDRRLVPGQEWDHEIASELEAADVVLLLVSSDFMASDYINDVEIARAMERHEEGSAHVIPIVLRPCIWDIAPFSQLQALPKDAKPVDKWANVDEAYLNIAEGIRRVAESLEASKPDNGNPPSTKAIRTRQANPRSGNMRVRQEFTDQNRDEYKHEACDFIRRYIEGSLDELAMRHADIHCSFRSIDANRFVGVIYRNGEKVSACTISVGGMLGHILYSSSENARDNSCNESLSVEADDQALFLRPMGMSTIYAGRQDDDRLTMEGGAELFWGMLIEPLQR